MSYKIPTENMRSFEDKLQKMQEKGLLTEKQKQDMGEAVADIQKSPASVATVRKPLPTGIIILVVLVFFAISIFIASLLGQGTSEPETIQKVSETINQIGTVGAMDKSSQSILFVTAIFGIPLIITIVSFMFVYNSLVTHEENVLGSWAQVESNLQRRADLIPDLVTTVKTFIKHEKEVLVEVTASRSGALGEMVGALEDIYGRNTTLRKVAESTAEKLGDDTFMKNLASEQQKIGRQVHKLMGVIESYPELRSSDQFMALQAQLEGTENRINVARMMFNDEVRQYNASIRKIPSSFVASMGDFKRKAYFEADDDVENKRIISF